MPSPQSVLPLVLRRSMAGKGMLAVVGLGVFVAATLLASAPIYARAMSDLGLTFTVREELSAQPSTRVQLRNVPLATGAASDLRAAIEQRITERIGWFRTSESRHLQLGRFGIAKPGEPAPRGGLFQSQPQALPGYESHVRVIEGELPRPSGPGEPLPLALGRQAATASRLAVGDVVELREAYDTCERMLPTEDPPPPPPPCNPSAVVEFTIPARISGIIEPVDPTDPFWVVGAAAYFDPFRLQVPDIGPILPMFTDEASLLNNFGSRYPSYPTTVNWLVFADPGRLTQANFERATSDIEALGAELAPLNGIVLSPLEDTLGRYGRSANYQQTPLAVLLLEITGIALFYVALVSAIVVERQAAEIALLRSRGASMLQIATMYLWQGLLVAVPALLLAPFIAAAATALLGISPTFDAVSEGQLLPVSIPPIAFAAAAAGAFLSLLALLAPALITAHRSTTAQRRMESRPGPSILQRYYLDFVLAAAAALVLFELDQRGSAFEPSSTGGLTSDPLLLASPALVIAAAGALVLRFYPLAVRIIAKLVNAVAGASVSLGLAQVVRNPGQYTRLTLLLMMAVAVGTYAASYTSTTDRSYSDRASFETGSDLRVPKSESGGLAVPVPELQAVAAAVPGVERASQVVRTVAGPAATGNLVQEDQLLGVEPDALERSLWWRDDFADASLHELLGSLAGAEVLPGKPLPGTPATLSVWVKGTDTHSDVTLWARYRDANGHYASVLFDKLNTGGQWKQLSVTATPQYETLQTPLTLVSLILSEPSNRFATNYQPLYLDDLSVTDKNGTTQVVDDFEGPLRWTAFQSRTPTQDEIALSPEDVHGGKGAARFTFRPGTATSDTRGIYFTNQILPIPAIVSEAFAGKTGARVGTSMNIAAGGGGTLVPIQVQGIYRLFPTLGSGPSIVVDRTQLAAWDETAAFTTNPELTPDELFISLAPGADEAAVVTALESKDHSLRIESRAEQLDRNRRNPLIAAGGSGILFVAFLAILLLVAAALMVSLLTSVRRRRIEFAVARSMGLSRGQILRMLALEYALVAVTGVTTGTLLGLVVGRRMLSFLDVTESGTKVEPAFILQTEWAFEAISVGTVLLIFGAALLIATRIVSSIAGAQALRTE